MSLRLITLALFALRTTSALRWSSCRSCVNPTALYSTTSSSPSTPSSYVTIPIETLLSGIEPRISTPNTRHTQAQLKNVYLGLRHGQSQANLLGIVSSNPAVGEVIHNLTTLGKQQAEQSASLLFPYHLTSELVFISSNFTRAKETAEHSITALKAAIRDHNGMEVDFPITIDTRLRER
jgi:hypothetical protein